MTRQYVSGIGHVTKDIIDGHKVVAMKFDGGELGWYEFSDGEGWNEIRALSPDEIKTFNALREAD